MVTSEIEKKRSMVQNLHGSSSVDSKNNTGNFKADFRSDQQMALIVEDNDENRTSNRVDQNP